LFFSASSLTGLPGPISLSPDWNYVAGPVFATYTADVVRSALTGLTFSVPAATYRFFLNLGTIRYMTSSGVDLIVSGEVTLTR
jgi:hypothetical protein